MQSDMLCLNIYEIYSNSLNVHKHYIMRYIKEEHCNMLLIGWIYIRSNCILIIKFMVMNPIWEANGCLATQRISNNVMNWNLHYSGYNNRPFFSVLSQIIPSYICKLCTFNCIIIVHSRFVLPSTHFPYFCYQIVVIFHFLSDTRHFPHTYIRGLGLVITMI
jgi:hypothetical protein